MADTRNWQPYAYVLDQYLAGRTYRDIATELGISNQRVCAMVKTAKAQLAFRVFRGLPRPIPRTPWLAKAAFDLRLLPPGYSQRDEPVPVCQHARCPYCGHPLPLRQLSGARRQHQPVVDELRQLDSDRDEFRPDGLG